MIISNANLCVNDNTNQSKKQEQKLGYVYRHIRLDTNMPFYIGISTMNGDKNERAKSKASRSKEWKEVISETEYRVDILLENVPYLILGDKEKYFIKLYGRVDLGTGTLVNKTSGGQGSHGAIVSEEERKKRSDRQKGRKHTDETRKKMREDRKTPEYIKKQSDAQPKKPVGKYKDGNLIKEYPSARATGIDGYSYKHVSNCCLRKRKNHGGFQWKFL